MSQLKSTRKSSQKRSIVRGQNVNYCLNCGSKMSIKLRTKQFCSIACRSANQRKVENGTLTKKDVQMRAKRAKLNHCVRCGKLFPANVKGRAAKCCSDVCRVRLCVERQDAAYTAIRLIEPDTKIISVQACVKRLVELKITYDPQKKMWLTQDKLF